MKKLTNFLKWVEDRNKILQEATAEKSWVYHITLLNKIDSIAASGLIPGQGSNFSGMGGWSKDKNFFTTTTQGIHYWIDKLHGNVLNQYESLAWDKNNWVNNLSIPVVIRFPFNKKGKGRWGEDDQGDPQRDFFTYREIPPESQTQIWDGTTWIPITSQIDYTVFLDKEWDEFIQDDHPGIPDELAFYWTLKDPYPISV